MSVKEPEKIELVGGPIDGMVVVLDTKFDITYFEKCINGKWVKYVRSDEKNKDGLTKFLYIDYLWTGEETKV